MDNPRLTINGRPLDWHAGMTVQDCLDKMGYSFSHITVTVNDVLIEADDFDRFIVPKGAEVQAIHLHHSG